MKINSNLSKSITRCLLLVVCYLTFSLSITTVSAQNRCNEWVSDPTFCSMDCPAEDVDPSLAPDTTNHYYCKGAGSLGNEGSIYNPALNPKFGQGEGNVILAKLLAAIINLFFIAGSVAVLVFMLIGGLAWITSEGDKSKMEVAKNRLTFTALGIVVIAASYAVLKVVGSFLGIDFFTDLIIKWPTIVGP